MAQGRLAVESAMRLVLALEPWSDCVLAMPLVQEWAMGSACWLVEELDCRLERWSAWVLGWAWVCSLEPLLDMAQGQLEEEWVDWLEQELEYQLEP